MNLNFQHKPKYVSSFKNPHIKIELLLRGQKFLKLLYSIMNLNTIFRQGEQKSYEYMRMGRFGR
jgi:hypothetical protein